MPASEILHLALLDERVDLTRGVPQLAVALRDLRHLDGAQEASVIALRANASNQGFIVTKSDATDAEVPTEDVYLDGDPFSYKALGIGQDISRVYVTRLQDRIIKLEMRVRAATLLPPQQSRLLGRLTNKQMAALRFASDEELPELLERAVRGNLKPDDIKRAVKAWVADHDRT